MERVGLYGPPLVALGPNSDDPDITYHGRVPRSSRWGWWAQRRYRRRVKREIRKILKRQYRNAVRYMEKNERDQT